MTSGMVTNKVHWLAVIVLKIVSDQTKWPVDDTIRIGYIAFYVNSRLRIAIVTSVNVCDVYNCYNRSNDWQ